MAAFIKENRKKIAAICAIVLAVALIAASVVALAATNTSTEGTNSQTQEVAGVASGTSSASAPSASSAASSQNKGDEAAGTKSEDAKAEEKAQEEVKGASADGTHGEAASAEDGGDAAASASSAEASSASSEGTSVEPGAEAGTVPQNAGTVPPETSGSDENDADAGVIVRVTIDAAGHGSVEFSGDVSLDEGASVYDALKATGVAVNARDTQYGVYVGAIGGLAERSAGGESGWKYAVNGVEPATACSNYKLKSGDVVKWKFVTKASEAVG